MQKHLQITERDVKILATLSDYQFLTTLQIEKLFFTSYDRARRRLWSLWQHKLVERLFLPIIPGKNEVPFIIYALSRNGANILAEKNGIDTNNIRYISSKAKASQFLMKHTLLRNTFRICIELTARKVQNISLLFWNQSPNEIKDAVYVQKGYEKIRIPLVPDGLFALQVSNKYFYFVVEIDRTINYKKYGEKLRGYYQWFLEGGHKEKFGAENIRILTITYPSRLERLFNLALQVREDQKGSGIFWFTTFEKISLESPENVLSGKIWLIAHQGENGLHALI